MRKLREESWYGVRESFHTYKRKRDGVHVWQSRERGSTATYVFISLTMQEASDPEVEIMELFHTHLLSYAYPDFGDRDKARTKELPLLLMPPSLMDVMGAIYLMSGVGSEVSAKVRFRAADPSGVWEYAPDMNSPFFAKALKFRKQAQALQWENRDDIQNFIKQNKLDDEDPRKVFMWIVEKKQEFTDETQKIIERAIALEQDFFSDERVKKIFALELSHRGFLPNAPELKELIEQYQAIGVRVAFTGYAF